MTFFADVLEAVRIGSGFLWTAGWAIILGLMILILFGWEFLLAEILGGLVLIAIMALLVRWTLPASVFDEARPGSA